MQVLPVILSVCQICAIDKYYLMQQSRMAFVNARQINARNGVPFRYFPNYPFPAKLPMEHRPVPTSSPKCAASRAIENLRFPLPPNSRTDTLNLVAARIGENKTRMLAFLFFQYLNSRIVQSDAESLARLAFIGRYPSSLTRQIYLRPR